MSKRPAASASRVLLVHPPTGLYVREDRCQSYIGRGKVADDIRPPMEIAYAAALLERAGIRCLIRDYPVEGGTLATFKRDLEIFRPDMLVLSCVSPSIDKDLATCRIAKSVVPDVITVARGTHFLLFDEPALNTYPDLDFAVRGESEYTLLELALGTAHSSIRGLSYRCNGTPRRSPDRPFIENLDELPFPARHLLCNDLYVRADTGEPQATIQTSRGCPYRCVFCLTKAVSGTRLRARSPGTIAAEIRECVEAHRIRNFFFRSDTFTVDRQWALAVCRELIEQRMDIQWVCSSRVDTLDDELLHSMKRAGCWGISLGVESGSPEMLSKMRKGITLDRALEAVRLCRKHGIVSFTYFVLGLPWETRTTMEETFRFSRRLDSDLVEYYFAYPYPGTDLYDYVSAHGLLQGLPPESQAAPAFDTFWLKKHEMERLRKRALARFYLRPRHLARTAARIRTGDQAVRFVELAWRAFKKNYLPTKERP